MEGANNVTYPSAFNHSFCHAFATHANRIDRRKVLRHHPDKKAGSKTIAHVGTNDDAFFKCIQKAHETLTNSERRRQFDSVDWNIEDEVPDLKSIPADKFCSVIAPIFAREGRFSNVQPVAPFGDNEAPKKDVEGFYDFWYNFDSWRSFEWHDKEVNEGSDSYVFFHICAVWWLLARPRRREGKSTIKDSYRSGDAWTLF